MEPEEPTGRRKVLVPFDVGFFLKAPYGRTRAERGWDRPPPRLDPRSRRRANLVAIGCYVLLGLSVWGGVRLWHGWSGALGGLGIAVVVFMFGAFVVALVSGVRGLRRPH